MFVYFNKHKHCRRTSQCWKKALFCHLSKFNIEKTHVRALSASSPTGSLAVRLQGHLAAKGSPLAPGDVGRGSEPEQCCGEATTGVPLCPVGSAFKLKLQSFALAGATAPTAWQPSLCWAMGHWSRAGPCPWPADFTSQLDLGPASSPWICLAITGLCLTLVAVTMDCCSLTCSSALARVVGQAPC